MPVVDLELLKQVKKTEVIELPAFYDGTPFVAEVKRPNLMNLITANKIPNTLLSAAMSMFKGGVGGAASEAMENTKSLKDLASLMQTIAENTLVTPSYSWLKENDIELTEEQLVEILNYMQGGAKSLTPFRNKQECEKDNKPVD
ncbi:esterase [Paraclostridium bifermentans]|uniref:esterase n=1 Tax=Paraclostridium bifermentans TaxID=1490 RepID=UPI00241C1625|nr:esterase [Paraclostridium bifermentans]MBS5952582.1 esterase [Paraclostridium bifermentans]